MPATIAHISDVHFGTIVDPQIVDALVNDINALSPTLVVCSGDLTQRARRGQYSDAARFLRRFTSPTLVVPGNHDVPLFDLFHRVVSPLRNYRGLITNELMPVFRNDAMIVVGINTARVFTPRLRGFWKDGAITPEQAHDAVKQFDGAGDEVARIIVTHHPFLAPPGQSNEDVVHGAVEALKIFSDAAVDLLLAGHLHSSYQGDPRTAEIAMSASNKMLSVQAGTATSGRVRREANAFNMIHIQKRQIQIEVRRWRDEVFAVQTAAADDALPQRRH